MRPGKRFYFWWLLQKRLLKKPMFLILLVLIPILCFGYSAAARDAGSVLTIALAQAGDDPLATAVMDDLVGSSDLIRFRICESRREAEHLVQLGKADAAWIFPEDMQQKLERFVSEPRSANAFVEVVERENNVLLLLSREKLSGTLYSLCAQRMYLQYLRQNVPGTAQVPDDQLLRYFRETQMPSQLFRFTSTSGAATPQADLLTSPVRGLLAVITVLCGISAAMYYCRDLERGTFLWLPNHLQPLAELGCVLTATGDLAVASFLSLTLSGLTANILWELVISLLFALSSAAFSMALRRLCGSVKALGALLPLLVSAMLVLCPVFFSLRIPGTLQYLLPPTGYIRAAYDPAQGLSVLLYTAVAFGVYLLAGKILKRK